jgi:hypothetical protein
VYPEAKIKTVPVLEFKKVLQKIGYLVLANWWEEATGVEDLSSEREGPSVVARRLL